jgi:flagellar hook protein FlgE
MGFNIGLSGLRAATSDLTVTGNNIANAGTVGFKQSRAEFADVYAASVFGSGKNSQGGGVVLANVSQMFNQGTISSTQNALDLAINGSGFFQTSNGVEVSYTRAGYFGTDRDGFMVNNVGSKLQGYSVDANNNIQSGVVADLQIGTASQAPKATTAFNQTFNLNSTNQIPLTTAFNPADPTSYNSATSTNIYDSQGNSHVMTQYFVKQATPNTWEMKVLIDGRNPASPATVSPGPDTGADPFTASMVFSASGQLLSTTPGDFAATVPAKVGAMNLSAWTPASPSSAIPPIWSSNGTAPPFVPIEIDLSPSTQFASSFAVNSVSQDGYTTGQLSGLEIDESGVIFARFTNGQSNIQGQVILANFANEQGLSPVGKTAWAQSFQSGEPVIGTPGSATLGSLQSGALEDSNVELSDQLVNLIVAQRNYQANAKTIETESAVTQTIINLR